jgi:hypothetical protein
MKLTFVIIQQYFNVFVRIELVEYKTERGNRLVLNVVGLRGARVFGNDIRPLRGRLRGVCRDAWIY